jgi:hypothetical protein
MDMIKSLKERWKGYKEKRFLENYGCKTWREYERKYDADVGFRARWAHTYYHGYPHVLPMDPKKFSGWALGGTIFQLVDKMTEWCEQNCQGKWRNDWHRGFWDAHGNYEFNGIGGGSMILPGGDVMFFAFKEESDYVWFMLTWQ